MRGLPRNILRAAKRRLRVLVAPVLFLAVGGYFAFNAMEGERGLKAYAQRQRDLVMAQSELTRAEADLATWERRVAGLRTNNLNLDTLDERSRAMLNLADPNEILLPYGQGKKLF